MSLRSWLAWIGLTLLLGAGFVLAYYSLTLGADWAARLFPEDHFFEDLGAGSLFLAVILSLLCFWRAARQGRGVIPLPRTALYLVMTLVFLFACGEEIGWGQRLFHTAQNSPSSGTLTNPAALSDPLPRANDVFNVALVVLGIGLPAALLLVPSLRRFVSQFLPLRLFGTAPLFLLNQLMAGWARDSYRPWYRYKGIRFPQALQEVKEANFEVLCFILAIIALVELGSRLRQVRATPRAAPKEG